MAYSSAFRSMTESDSELPPDCGGFVLVALKHCVSRMQLITNANQPACPRSRERRMGKSTSTGSRFESILISAPRPFIKDTMFQFHTAEVEEKDFDAQVL